MDNKGRPVIDLKPACEQMIVVVARITDDQLSSSSPCVEYSVGELIDHVDHVSRLFTALALHDTQGLQEAATGPVDAHLEPDWRDSVAQHIRALGNAWDDPAAWQGGGNVPGSDLSNEMWGKITLTEMVVHGWDIAKATGQPFNLPIHTLQTCHDHVAEFLPNAPNPALWGPPVDVASDAILIERIVAITGRLP